jgi:CII-binding regulator of phage lambda lysogenization HflD
MNDGPDLAPQETALLRRLRRLTEKLDRIAGDVRDVKQRMTAMEQQLGHFAATEASHYASQALRLDRIEDRLDRVERQADHDDHDDGAG